MAGHSKTDIFERMPVPKAVMSMALPTITSSLVMVLYNWADTVNANLKLSIFAGLHSCIYNPYTQLHLPA